MGSRVYLALEVQLLELVRRQKTIVYVCQGGCLLMENAHRVHRAHTNGRLETGLAHRVHRLMYELIVKFYHI